MDTSRYQKGLIYKLCCRDTTITDCYVGSTCAFRKRKSQHKSDCNNDKKKGFNRYLYQFIRDHGGFSNWDMIELIKYPCNTKRELELKEREYIELLGATLNRTTPSRGYVESYKAHYQKHKERLKEKTRVYYKNNKEGILENSKEYYQKNKEQLKEKTRVYYQANKEEVDEKKRLNYQINKKQINEKFNCECGGRFTKQNKSTHLKSLNHQKYLNEIKE